MFTGDYSTGNAVLITAQEFVRGMRGQVVIPDSELTREFPLLAAGAVSDYMDSASRGIVREDAESAYWRIHE